jgi:hypothetical protein
VNLLARLALWLDDRRTPWLIEHSVAKLVTQRVYGLALGQEDLRNHDELRARRAAGARVC